MSDPRDPWELLAERAELPRLDPDRRRLVLDLARADAASLVGIVALAREAIAIRRGRQPKLVRLGDGRLGWVFDPLGAIPPGLPARLRRDALARTAVALLDEGLAPGLVARLVDVPPRTLRRWRRAAKSGAALAGTWSIRPGPR